MVTSASSWEQAAAGDADAFAACYMQYADRVFAHCFVRVGSRAEAEDITAKVFEITWRRRADVYVDAEAGIFPWLLTTANNLIAEHHRATTKLRKLVSRLPRLEDEPDPAITLVEADALDRDLALAMTVLLALKGQDREVIELCIMHGLSPTSAANSIGISASTLRTRLQRALLRARRLYRSTTQQPDGGVTKEANE